MTRPRSLRFVRTLAVLPLVLALAGCVSLQPSGSGAASAGVRRNTGSTQAQPAPEARATAPRMEKPPMAAAEESGAQPPLLDRDLFFGDPKIAASRISPDGRHLSFIKPYEGVLNIWVKGLEEPFSAARPITADTERPVRDYFWSEDGRYVLYAQDKGGNENYHIYAVDPRAEAEASTGVPPARDLTPLEKIRAVIYAVPEAHPDEIIVGINDRDPALHDVYTVNIETGERHKIIQNDQNVGGWITDLDGRVRLAYRQTPDGGSEILKVENGALGASIYSCDFQESCYPVRFHKDGRRVYITTNKGDDVDLTRLALLDVETGRTEVVESDPEGEVDFGGTIFSDKTEELIGTVYVGDRVRIYPRDPRFARTLEELRGRFPGDDLGFESLTNDDHYFKLVVSSDVDPGTVYLYDWNAGKVEKLYESRPELPQDQLAHMQPVHYAARDGRSIPAYLTLPKGKDPKNLPTIIHPHGGPWARDAWGYNPVAQFLANRGYAVLQPNFRGSTGYGKDFLNAGNMQWGTGAMQHDLTDAVRYLVSRGIADPKRVAIMGGSYGGYATLAGVTFTPDLYAAGVDIVGPSNIVSLVKSFPACWGPFMKIWYLRVGDPSDPAQRERLEAQSPSNFVDRIKAPLLVIQGANDPRVNKPESDRIVAALRDRGRKVEYLVAPDEGHGFAGRENRLAMFASIEEFLGENLGGRWQKEMAPDIASRLETLTVDVASVKAPEAPGGEALARAASIPLPMPAASPRLGTVSYHSDIRLGAGQQIAIESHRTVAADTLEGRKVWRVETTAESPMGSTRDLYYLDNETLRPIQRSATQGGVVIEIRYSDDAVKGKIQAGPQEIPLDTALEGPVFGDQAALETVLGTLPLESGYATTLRTYDIQSQKVRIWKAAVDGRETVSVPAGSFQAWKVTLTPMDGQGTEAYWVAASAPAVVVKGEATLPPAAGGGTAVTVLTSGGTAK